MEKYLKNVKYILKMKNSKHAKKKIYRYILLVFYDEWTEFFFILLINLCWIYLKKIQMLHILGLYYETSDKFKIMYNLFHQKVGIHYKTIFISIIKK